MGYTHMFIRETLVAKPGFVRLWLVWTQIVLQLTFSLFPTFSANAAEVKGTEPESFFLSEDLNQAANSLVANNLQQSVSQAKGNIVSGATSSASSSVQSWLSQFGTAKVQLNVDEEGHWDQSSLDWLIPLYDNQKSILFSQLGLRAPDNRVTTNLGMGVRTFYLKNWMLGGNVFFDNDMTGKNRRVGFGAEAWTNYLKFSANSYLGTTQWHSSHDFDDYDEKPADGFDLRAEAYLPALPQLGAKIVYEKYYGDKVALFDTDDLQKNPSAVTLGLSYTPVPLVTLATNYRRGQDDMDDMQFQVDMKFDFAHDWRYQLSPENVVLQRTLAGSRYDLVERNNQIILQYQKKEIQGVSKLLLTSLTDNSPADGLAQNTLQAQAFDAKGEVVKGAAITWSSGGQATLDKITGTTDAAGMTTVNISDTQNEMVDVTAASGGVSGVVSTHFNEVEAAKLVLTVDKNGSVADGQTTDDATVSVTDINNHPVMNAKLAWAVESPATLADSQSTSDSEGLAHVKVTSLKAGEPALSVSSGGLSTQKSLLFIVNAQQANIESFTMTTDTSPANGLATNSALVIVRDPAGNPVQNESVEVKADKTTVSFVTPAKARSATPGKTNSDGELRVYFTDTVAENVQLTASLDNGDSKQTQATFVADAASQVLENLSLTQDNSVANGIAKNQAVVYVHDKNNNPFSGATVNWAADKASVKLASATTTDSNGMATATFTDTVAETTILTSSLTNGSRLSTSSHFVADGESAKLHDLKVIKDGALANGTEADMAQVYVLDGQGNPLANQLVTWSAQPQGTTFQPANTSITDETGKALVSYTSKIAQSIQLTASLSNGENATVPSLFIPDTSSEHIKTYTVTTGALANGSATNNATVIVTDANNNPVANEKVNWSVSGSAQASALESITDAQGAATITLNDTKAESVNVKISLNNGANQSKTSEFIADVSSAKISTLTATSGAIANGVATNYATVSVVDANENPLPQIAVTWLASGNAQLGKINTTTLANGQSSVTFTDLHAEAITLTASITGGQSKQVNSQFVADGSHALISSLAVTKDASPADGKTANSAQIVVLDANSNPVEGAQVTWTFDSTTVSHPAASVTDSSGKANLDFTDTVEQPVNLTAVLANSEHKTVASQFVADVTSAKVTLTTVKDSQMADGKTADIINAVVTDALGHTIANQQISWSVGSSPTAVIEPASQTNSTGQSQVNVTDTVGESVNVTATLTNSSMATLAVVFTSHSVSTLTVNGTSQPADGTSLLYFTATVTDEKGVLVKNSPVSFTNTGSAVPSAAVMNTDGTGKAVVTLKDATPEDVTVTAKSTDYELDKGKEQQVTFEQDQITDILVQGYRFAPDVSFPKTGFLSAQFTLVVGGDQAKNADYTWTSNQSWIRIDNPGVVRMAVQPTASMKTVTVSATPVSGKGKALTYTFSLQHWLANIARSGPSTIVDSDCANKSMTVPSDKVLSDVAPSNMGVRAVGSLWGEWGDLGLYDWSTSSSAESMWADENGSNGTRIYVHWRDGYVNERVPTVNMDEVCQLF